MGKERIGKLERWILIHTYLKTLLLKLPENWISPNGQGSDEGFDVRGLFKSEILLNYFKALPLSSKYTPSSRHTKFAVTKEYQRALVSISRSINSLQKKQFIEVFTGYFTIWTGIELSNTGKGWVEKSGYLKCKNLKSIKRQDLPGSSSELSSILN